MPIRKRKESREQRRLARGSMKQGTVLRRPAHPGRILAIVLAVLSVVTAALLTGGYLKARSDAFRQDRENGNWTLEENVTPQNPVSVPDIRAVSIRPEGNVGDILIAGEHGGIILPLQDGDGTLLYASDVAAAAHLPLASSPVDLSADVARVQKRELNVTCAITLTCFTEADPSLRVFRRGLELALLREYAEAGMDDLLLMGLPAGNRTADRQTMEFLQELRTLLADLSSPPAIGVALPGTAFATDETYTPPADPTADEIAGIPEGTAPLYAGNITPARLRTACDYIALDLRDKSPDEAAAILPHIRYAYVRHSLRLLIDRTDTATLEDVLSHGFSRVFEMDTPRAEAEKEQP